MKFEGPTQFESQQPKERSPEYLKTLAELEGVLGKPEEDQRSYIDKRIASLDLSLNKFSAKNSRNPAGAW